MEDQLTSILDKAIADRIFPGAVVGVLHGENSHIVSRGKLTYDVDSELVTDDTIYDVASVTKSISVGTLALIALEEGLIKLDDKATDFLPELTGDGNENITIKHLLTHTVIWLLDKGISAYAREEGAQAVLDALYKKPLRYPAGEEFLYTNSATLLLGFIIEKVYKTTLDKISKKKLFTPLNMNHTTFFPDQLKGVTVAPTEIDDRGINHMTVHDEAAHALREIGIVAGNAGLFSNAPDLLKFFLMIHNKGSSGDYQILAPATIDKLSENAIADIGESAALGWELNQPRYMGTASSRETTFGKTGFTGCLVACDTTKQIALVFLSNAQYPKRHDDKDRLNAVRAAISDEVFK